MSCKLHNSPFTWNAGGWFGALFGSTLWMLALGIGVLAEDLTAAGIVIASCAAGILWGIGLWRCRERLAAHAGLQWLMVGLLVVFAVAVVTVNARIPSIFLPYWAIAMPLPLMGVFWRRQRTANGPLREVAKEFGRPRP